MAYRPDFVLKSYRRDNCKIDPSKTGTPGQDVHHPVNRRRDERGVIYGHRLGGGLHRTVCLYRGL